MSSYRDQKNFIDALKRYEQKMSSKEQDIFKMIVKRDKDDEDLDSVSFGNLKELYTKYYVNRKKPNLDNLFKN
jgi:hypothetical protein